ncbi:hypothetical protein [Bacillus sp. JJ722]
MAEIKNELSLAKINQVSEQLDQTEQSEIEEGLYKGLNITFYPLFDNN